MLRRDDLNTSDNTYFLPEISGLTVTQKKRHEFDILSDSRIRISSNHARISKDIKKPEAFERKSSFKFPLTPEITLFQFKSLLSPYEQHEIFAWPEIYFPGSAIIEKIGTAKRTTGAVHHEMHNIAGTYSDQDGSIHNSGYDDSRGDLYLTKNDHIAYRYEILSLLGKGSFGQVVKCYDHKEKTNVAVKVIRNKKRFEKQGIVEVNILNKLTGEDSDYTYNLVHVSDHFYFRGHLCFVFEILGINLYEWMKAGGFQGIHLGLVRKFSMQILNCLSLLDRLRIIHCDLKPENVLLVDQRNIRPHLSDANNRNYPSRSFSSRTPPNFNPNLPIYDIKVIDFGSSCYEDERMYTYVQSRFYRSPEVILGLEYTTAIDMWSFGCVLAELYSGYPLFPGENESEQLALIMELRGLPPANIQGSRYKAFFDSKGNPRNLTNSKGRSRKPGSKALSSVLRCTDMAFLDFLEQCLQWDPTLRMKPDAALFHPFITKTRFIPTSLSKPSSYSSHAGERETGRNSAITSEPYAKRQFSYGSIKEKLPTVSLGKFGSQLSKAVGPMLDRKKSFLPTIPVKLALSKSSKKNVKNLNKALVNESVEVDPLDAELALFEEELRKEEVVVATALEIPAEQNLAKGNSLMEDNKLAEEDEDEQRKRFLEINKRKKLFNKIEKLKAKRNNLKIGNVYKHKSKSKQIVKCFQDEFSD